jgi:hypothetical protein
MWEAPYKGGGVVAQEGRWRRAAAVHLFGCGTGTRGLGGWRAVTTPRWPKEGETMELILWILAVILVISGVVSLIRGAILMGILLIVVGLLVGPGGVSVFT